MTNPSSSPSPSLPPPPPPPPSPPSNGEGEEEIPIEEVKKSNDVREYADPSEDNKGDASWICPYMNSPSSLRLSLHVFPKKIHAGHSVIDCRLFGRNRVKMCKWNGWGYADTYVSMSSSSMIRLHGNRYSLCGVDMGHWHEFMESIPGIEFTFTSPAQNILKIPPKKNWSQQFIDELKKRAPNVEIDDSNEERLFYSHGHTCQEIYQLRYGSLSRLPDVILYPKEHNDVEVIVDCAIKHNICLIPFGGGTSVTLGVCTPEEEERMVATVSLSFMQKILYLDRDALLMWVEAGAVGASIEERLRPYGVTLGHEPDSMEFSTVGGWVATRASGMKKNRYGNIEDLVVDIKVVTTRGCMHACNSSPRISSGPSLQQLFLGSEGIYGIITQVLLKIKPIPEYKVYDCLAFPSFSLGVLFLRELSLSNIYPSSCRLMDSTQTQCGSLFRVSPPGGPGIGEVLMDKIKKYYINKIKGYKEEELCGCTLVYEGNIQEINIQKKYILFLCKKYGGLPAGSKNGERGYQMTFLIAYLRDFIMEHHWLFESFESSLPWTNILICYKRIKEKINNNCILYNIKYSPIIMTRLTQIYPTGAVLYFYFGFNWAGLNNPIEVFNKIEHDARQVILDCGGSISHHHGVGKLRKEFMSQSIGQTGVDLLKATKEAIDPLNIFGNGNLI